MKEYIIGFDIGGSKCAVLLGERSSCDSINIAGKEKFMTCEFSSPFRLIENLTEKAFSLLLENNLSERDISGIGISCGGPLDSKKGIIKSPPNLPGWDDIHITEILEKSFPCPVFLQNDANACALAEWKYGAGKGTQNMIFLTFGTGMGAGLILNGHLYEGTCGMAGECGHIRLAENGPAGYGKAGSFEGFCSGGGIAKLAQQIIDEELKSGHPVPWVDNPEKISAKTVAEAADNGDKLAKRIYEDSGRYLGKGLSILIDILNPEMIVIGSIFARSEELLRNKMIEELKKEALPSSLSVCRIVPCALGESIGDIASLSIVEQNKRN